MPKSKYSDRHVRRLVNNQVRDQRILREEQQPRVNPFDFEVEPEGMEIENDANSDVENHQQSDNENNNNDWSDNSVSSGESETDHENDLSSGVEENDQEFQPDAPDLRTDVRKWALEMNVQPTQISALLKVLKPYHPNLPLDSRTLLKTPRGVIVKEVPPGQYIHFGFTRSVSKIVKDYNLRNKVTMEMSADGIPIAKSSNSQLWVIQGHVIEAPKSSPFVIGIWGEHSKPTNFSLLLEDFVEEVEAVQETRITVNGRHLDFILDRYIADAPARAALANIKGHTSKIGCGKCKQKGRKFLRRVVFSKSVAELRTDEDFYDAEGNEHILGPSILTRLRRGLVTYIPYEYMHLVLQGIMKKMLRMWVGKDGHKKGRIRKRDRTSISNTLLQFRVSTPVEFQRKPLSLSELDRWKATEYRQFLLYTGPVALKPILQKEYYDHFLLFHIAIVILSTRELYSTYNEYASYLLTKFVQDFGKLYGRETISYNVHGLLHLSQDALKFGPLDQWSAFRYENNLQKVKRLISSTSCPLQQVANRIAERLSFGLDQRPQDENYPIPKVPYSTGAKLHYENVKEFKTLKFENFTMRLGQADNVYQLKSGGLIRIENILQTMENNFIVIGKKFKRFTHFYDSPCNSVEFGILRVKKEFSALRSWSIEEIKCKCVALPYNRGLIIFPLLHCL